MLKTSDFYFDLPQEQIAQTPIEPRDHSPHAACSSAATGELEHRHFYDLPDYLEAGDTPGDQHLPGHPRAPLRREGGHRRADAVPACSTQKEKDVWEVHGEAGERPRPGARFVFGGGLLVGEILATVEGGNRLVRMHYEGTSIYPILEQDRQYAPAALYHRRSWRTTSGTRPSIPSSSGPPPRPPRGCTSPPS